MKTSKRQDFSIVYFYDMGGATTRLLPELSHALNKANMVFLVSKRQKESKKLHEWSKLLAENCSVVACWTDFTHPFQILKFLIRKKASILHMQLEFTLFSSNAFFSLTIPLLFFARFFLRTEIITTMHPVMPSDKFYEGFFLRNVLGLDRVRSSVVKFSLLLLYQILNVTCSTIIVHTRVQRNWLLDYGISPNKVRVVSYAPFIYDGWEEILRRKERWIDFFRIRGLQNKKKVLYVGMFGRNRGLEELVSALKMLKESRYNVVLMLAGAPSAVKGDEFVSHLNSIIKEESLEEDVVSVGWIDDADMYALCSITDCFVLLYKLVMSASSKLPIITTYLPNEPIVCTDQPILREQLNRHENVHFVPLDFSSRDLAKALGETLKSSGNNMSGREQSPMLFSNDAELKSGLLDLIDIYEGAMKKGRSADNC